MLKRTMLAVLLAMTTSAQAADCRKPASDTGKAICADADMKETDARIDAAFARLMKSRDAALVAALKQDQEWFVSDRDNILGNSLYVEDMQHDTLSQRLYDRASFLERVIVEPGEADVPGLWQNEWSRISVEKGEGGKLDIAAEAEDQSAGSWNCSAYLTGTPGKAGVTARGEEYPHYVMSMQPQGNLLIVTESNPGDEDGNDHPYCGFKGTLEGTYFRVGPVPG